MPTSPLTSTLPSPPTATSEQLLDAKAVHAAAPARFIQIHHQEPDAVSEVIRTELIAGLTSATAVTSPKYLYDALGSKLFAAICELDEYYPTRTEAAIVDANLHDIARTVGAGATLIDLGAGNCAKAARLFPALQPAQYVPIDISVDFLHESVEQLHPRFPGIEMVALGMDFSTALQLPPEVRPENRLFFYPGSSIGNFSPDQALGFLRRIRSACEYQGRADGGVLIGVDLVKDHAILDAAYDDALGLTAAFNLNLLRHLNRVLKADFHLPDWRHRGFFNPALSRVEMHLEARTNVTVCWEGGQRRFERGERIHTESSYKYTQQDFLGLLERAGFGTATRWSDPRNWYMLCHAQAK